MALLPKCRQLRRCECRMLPDILAECSPSGPRSVLLELLGGARCSTPPQSASPIATGFLDRRCRNDSDVGYFVARCEKGKAYRCVSSLVYCLFKYRMDGKDGWFFTVFFSLHRFFVEDKCWQDALQPRQTNMDKNLPDPVCKMLTFEAQFGNQSLPPWNHCIITIHQRS